MNFTDGHGRRAEHVPPSVLELKQTAIVRRATRTRSTYVNSDDVFESRLHERPRTLVALLLLAPDELLGILVLLHFLSEFIGRERAELLQAKDDDVIALALVTLFVQRVVMLAAGEQHAADFLRIDLRLNGTSGFSRRSSGVFHVPWRDCPRAPVGNAYHHSCRSRMKCIRDDVRESSDRRQSAVCESYESSKQRERERVKIDRAFSRR